MAQIEAAIGLQKPLFLHERDAHPAFINLLAPYKNDLPRCVVHCFTGGREALERYLENGFYIGMTGWISDPARGGHLHALLPLVPEERLLLETDAPYLLPKTVRPKPKNRRNEPCYLPEVVRFCAEILGCEPEKLAAVTTANALRFLGLML